MDYIVGVSQGRAMFVLIAPLGVSSPALTYEVRSPCERGDLLQIPLKGKQILGVMLEEQTQPIDFACKLACESGYAFLPTQKLLAEFIARYYCCSFSQSYGLFTPQALSSQPQSTQSALDSQTSDTIGTPTLSQAQSDALAFINATTNPLLFGDTGSGKTEIYIHLIAQYLQSGQKALLLMPEISLTPQIEQRLRKVFGDKVGIWHSKITAKKKQEILTKLQDGTIHIIAGARSALFLPLENLGLIVIDEEHDDAYKSQSAPRYNARDLALYLGKHTRIKVLLGSATPSLSSYANARKEDRIYRLKGRYFGTQKSYIFDNAPLYAPSLLDSVYQAYQSHKQIIVFLPTRAHFKTLLCQECGSKVQCVFCSVSMSLHLDKNAMVCHYCGYTQAIPRACPSCQSPNLQSKRIGTQEFAKEMQEHFPTMRIGLFDRDHITTHNKLQKTLKDFNEHRLDMLVGTQMLSKGHDYHNVALCVVVGIDYVLSSVDYRANERAMSLLTQIAGRSGRKENGVVYIQTLHREFFEPFMQDYEEFLEYELRHRPRFYPPFVRLANLSFTHKSKDKACAQMQEVLAILENLARAQSAQSHDTPPDTPDTPSAPPNASFEIVGAKACDIERLYGKYRYNILLRSPSAHALLRAIVCARESVKFGFEIDIDPLSTI
ncbi:primosomal protein N' [uncultured Helicobacter sp.]|uniref:primosomal protein N' n=1 Tax=uncultured Helicobacter sp. TaxID=175537 RepID=UPI00375110DD